MSDKLTRYEPWLYATALVVAVTFRLINLASLPLSDSEATPALNALQLLDGSRQVSGSQPLYTLITGLLFFIFGSSDFLARLLPALAGCFLVLLPLYMRDELGKFPAIILSFGLAIDPALIAFSRQAGSVMPALALTISAACFAWKRRLRLAGFLAGLAVLCGATFWFGFVNIIAARIIINLIGSRASRVNKLNSGNAGPAAVQWRPGWSKNFWLVFVCTLILGGSFFLIFPTGLSAAGSGVLDYVKGWVSVGTASTLRVLAALLIYQTIPLLTGLAEGISGTLQKNNNRMFLLIAFLVFLTITLLYPGKQMGDVTWCVVFLWVLTAWLLARLVETPREVTLPVLGHAALVVSLTIFIILNILWVLGGFGGLDVPRSLAVLGGVVVIVIISFLVAYGWGIEIAVRGAFLGFGMVMLAIMLSLSVSAGGLNGESTPDLWHQNARVTGAAMLVNDLDEFSVWGTGVRDSLSVVVVHYDTPSMRWVLRNYPKTKFVNALSPGASPEVVITDNVYEPELASSYRGESFNWYTTADWRTMNALGMLEWIFHRTVSEVPTNLIFWVRQDLFVSGS
jgi:hypothetical protein